MATKAQIESFIRTIAPCAQKAYKKLGKVKPSVCIGMACVESGYGTAGSCKYNSFLGQKVGTGKTATKYWDGTFKSWKTTEEYKIGVHTAITDAFRTYSSMEQCVFNYYELLNSNVYSRVKSESDYKTQMQQIKACGYMTSSKEVNSVLSIIAKYNLTKYDDANDSDIGYVIYIKGTNYTLQANMNLRREPNGAKISVLNKGTIITCRDVQTDCKGNIWVRCPAGWICGMTSKGKVYLQ